MPENQHCGGESICYRADGHALLAVLLEASLEEVDVGVDVLVVTARGADGHTVVVEQDVEGLGVCAELRALQVTPTVEVRRKRAGRI